MLVTTQVLKECMPKDTIARIGGDEFLVVSIDPYTIPDITRTKNRIQQRLDQTFAADDHLKGLSASIGISHSEDGAVIMDSLIVKKAEKKPLHRKRLFVGYCPMRITPLTISALLATQACRAS